MPVQTINQDGVPGTFDIPHKCLVNKPAVMFTMPKAVSVNKALEMFSLDIF